MTVDHRASRSPVIRMPRNRLATGSILPSDWVAQFESRTEVIEIIGAAVMLVEEIVDIIDRDYLYSMAQADRVAAACRKRLLEGL